jgi:hypothetical protein
MLLGSLSFKFVLVFLYGVFFMYLVKFDGKFVENMLIWLEIVVLVELWIF